MRPGKTRFELCLPWARAPEVVWLPSEDLRLTREKLLASAQKKCGRGGKILEVRVDGVRAEAVFDRLPEEHVGCCAPWRDASPSVELPATLRQLGARIERTEVRAMSWSQLQHLDGFMRRLFTDERLALKDRDGKLVSYGGKSEGASTLNMYMASDLVVKPLTKPFRCSFMELISTHAQPPKVFMSHAWKTAWWQTMRLLSFYVQQRFPDAAEDVYIWICTFANNQHDLGELIGDLMDTPFVRAIRSEGCAGTVVVLDDEVTPFRRVWCVLEASVSLDARDARNRLGEEFFYDFLAWLPEEAQAYAGEAVPAQPTALLDRGVGEMPIEVVDSVGGSFPLAVAEAGVRIDIEEAEATNLADKEKILRHVGACEGCEGLNARVRGGFVPTAAYSFALEGEVAALEGLLGDFSVDEVTRGLSDGTTPVYIAAQQGHEDCLRLLLERGALPDRVTDDGTTSVHIAAQEGHEACLRLLLDRGADPGRATDDGTTPVHIVVQEGHEACLRLLLERGADPAQPRHDGVTPDDLAANSGRLRLMLRSAVGHRPGAPRRMATMPSMVAGRSEGVREVAGGDGGARPPWACNSCSTCKNNCCIS